MKKQLNLLLLILLSFYASSQNFHWARSVGSTGNEEGRSMVVDASGNVYSTGYFTGTADFDPGTGTFNLTSSGAQDIFISKMDASGNFIWAKKIGGTSGDYGLSIALDGPGNIYTTGYFQKTADFDPGSGISNLTSAGDQDIYILKLDPSGNFVWVKGISAVYTEMGNSIAIDGSGNIYYTGYFQGTVDFDPGVGTFNQITDNGDIFISKLDASGNFVWAKQIGGTADDRGLSIAIDGSGNLYSTGYYSGTVDFDPGAGTFNLSSTSNSDDIFVLKLNSSGNFIWAKGMGGAFEDEGRSIDVDGAGNVYTTGYFTLTVDFDPGSGTSNLSSFSDSKDAFISKLDASGNFSWVKRIGSVSDDYGYSINVNNSGITYVTGSFMDNVDLDPGAGSLNTTSAGKQDVFILKLDGTGNFIWATSIGGTGDDIGKFITTDATGNSYTSGSFSSSADFNPGARINNLTSIGATDIFISKLGTCDINIKSQPKDQSVNVNSNIKFALNSYSKALTYQWQQNSGSGFTNVSNGGQFLGATKDTLSITSIKTSQNNFKYRCILKNGSCSDTTTTATLTVKTNGINTIVKEQYVIYPNPASNMITIQSGNLSNGLFYTISNQTGQIVLKGDLSRATSDVDISSIEKGFYLIEISGESYSKKAKLLKL